jgi:beta-lactamase regulating signal transducer with metallopeptidase domain
VDIALNWLWQGLVIAAATALVLRVIPRTRPQARYRLAWAALLSVAVLPVLTLALPHGIVVADAGPAASAPIAIVSLPTRWWTSDTTSMAIYAAWVVVASAWAVRSFAALTRATRRSVPLGARDEHRLSHWLAVRTRGRAARLGVSSAVASAAVLAGRPPVIAIAPTLLADLSDADLDRVVIHEWAHVQRRDDLSVVLQLALRVVVGWHPAAWWLDRQVHAEREAACDDLAVSVTGSAKAYAECLATLAARRSTRLQPLPAVGAVAASGLRDRVLRILAPRSSVTGWRRWSLAGTGLVPCLLAVGVARMPIVDAAAVAAEVQRLEDLAVGVATAADDAPELEPVPTEPPRPDSGERGVAPQGHFGTASTPVVSSPPAPIQVSTSVPADQVPTDEPALPLISSSPTIPLDAPLGQPPAVIPMRPGAGATITPNHSEPPTLWGAAAEGGTAVGRGSQKAAVATAGFFTRVSKRIAGSF